MCLNFCCVAGIFWYIFTLIGMLLKLISDLTYMWVDPRIDFERRAH